MPVTAKVYAFPTVRSMLLSPILFTDKMKVTLCLIKSFFSYLNVAIMAKLTTLLACFQDLKMGKENRDSGITQKTSPLPEVFDRLLPHSAFKCFRHSCEILR